MYKAGNFQEYQKVVNNITQNIKEGKLIVGSKLPSERELCEENGTSRSSTREAISILRGMGVVESKPGSGNYITDNSAQTIKQIVEVMIAMGSISLKELLDYRRTISIAVGSDLIRNGMSAEDEKRIRQIIESMRTASDEEFCELDRDFHLSLINATRNNMFMTIMEPIGELYLDLIVPVIMSSTDDDRENRVPMHENIFKSILDKDEKACSEAMEYHYSYVHSKLM